MRRLSRALMQVAAGVVAFSWGCGDGTGPPAPVATVLIPPPDSVTLVVGGTQTLSAIPKDAKGNTLTDRIVTWSSSDSTKVSVVAGLVSGVALGSATVSASSEGQTASVTVKVKDGAVVSSAGTSFGAQGGAVNVSVPAGAVSQTINLTVSPAANPPANQRLLAGTAFDFGPSDGTFAQPITITIKYNPSLVVAGSPEGGLQLYEVVGTAWRVVAGSTVDLSGKTVSGAVSRLGTFAVMMQPKVETVTIDGDLSAMPVITTRQLTATLKDNEGTVLTRAVSWTSSNPAILAIDPATGVASAKVPGSVTITASSEGKSGTATISVVPGPPSKIVIVDGNNQSVAGGAAVPVAPSVRVTDAGDNPIASIQVVFAVASGGGTITGATATTNSSGIAAVGSWTLGTAAGLNTLTVTSPAISGVSVTFQAAGGAGPAANIAAFAGNNQTGTAGGNIPVPPSVKITDANGNFVVGYTVTFAPGSGSGSVTGGSAVTDAAGIATVGSWKLGTTPGPQTLTASGSGLTGSPVTFSATAVAPVASTVAAFAGNNQTARPGTAVATPPSVIVTDAAGVPVPGVAVTFSVTQGGGSVTGAAATTGANGVAVVGSWTLGPLPSQNTLIATSGTLSGSPVTFNASGVSPPATTIAMNDGDRQTATAGTPVAIPPSVKVTGADGLGVSGVSVTFSIQSGSGSITGANQVTNVSGIATVGSWTLGLGANSLSASVPGLSGNPITFLGLGTADVQIVTFGDSNTDLGFQDSTTSPKIGSYITSLSAPLRLGPNAANDPTQLAGKIESVWKANRSKTIRAVNHAIAGTGTGTGRTILTAPNALESVGGVTRFRGEVLGDAYPWSGGESVNGTYPNGAIKRVQAFAPRSSDFAYVSIGTNDVTSTLSNETIALNLQVMIDDWISRGLPPSHFFVTTLPPRSPAESGRIPDLNSKIRALQTKGVKLIDISVFVSADDGLTWKAASGDPSYPGSVHVINDFLHYSEVVRRWIADQVVSEMMALTP